MIAATVVLLQNPCASRSAARTCSSISAPSTSRSWRQGLTPYGEVVNGRHPRRAWPRRRGQRTRRWGRPSAAGVLPVRRTSRRANEQATTAGLRSLVQRGPPHPGFRPGEAPGREPDSGRVGTATSHANVWTPPRARNSDAGRASLHSARNSTDSATHPASSVSAVDAIGPRHSRTLTHSFPWHS